VPKYFVIDRTQHLSLSYSESWYPYTSRLLMSSVYTARHSTLFSSVWYLFSIHFLVFFIRFKLHIYFTVCTLLLPIQILRHFILTKELFFICLYFVLHFLYYYINPFFEPVFELSWNLICCGVFFPSHLICTHSGVLLVIIVIDNRNAWLIVWWWVENNLMISLSFLSLSLTYSNTIIVRLYLDETLFILVIFGTHSRMSSYINVIGYFLLT